MHPWIAPLIDWDERNFTNNWNNRFQPAKRKVSQACTLENVKFPCSVDGVKRGNNDTDCLLLFDMGCGFDCVDRALATTEYF